MKVAVLVKTNSGARWLAPFVARTVERGHEVKVFVAAEPGPLAARLEQAGAVAVPSAALGGPDTALGRLRALGAFRRAVRDFDPAVVNSHLYRSALVGRMPFGPGASPVRVHSVTGPLYLESRSIRGVERLIARRDDLIHCTAQVTATLYSQLGVPPESLRVIPYGVDLDVFRPRTGAERHAIRERLGLDDSGFVAVCVAFHYAPKRLGRPGTLIKGHDVLLDGWRRFRQAGGEGHLVLVGSGFTEEGEQCRQELFRRVDVAGDPSITVFDSVEDVREFYWASDVSVSPSRSENYGAAAEASAVGLPTIASRVGGLPELVVDGDTGWTFASEDSSGLAAALKQAVDARRRGTIKAMGARARATAEARLDVHVCADRYVDMLEEAVGPNRR